MFVFLCLARLPAPLLSLSLSLSLSQPFRWQPHAHVHTRCLAFWMSSLLLWTTPHVVKWHGPPPLVACLIVYMEPNFMPSPHPHPSADASFFPCLHPPYCSLIYLFLSVLPTSLYSLPPPYFHQCCCFFSLLLSSFALSLSLSLSLCVYALCARQPVRVFYCSSSSSPSWLRLVLWCQQPRAVLG